METGCSGFPLGLGKFFLLCSERADCCTGLRIPEDSPNYSPDTLLTINHNTNGEPDILRKATYELGTLLRTPCTSSHLIILKIQ